MARRKRSFTTFNLSFLDIMSCGFGAVILVFLIIDHSIEVESRELNVDLMSEVMMLEEDIREGEENRVALRNVLAEVDDEIVVTEGRATRIIEETEEYEALIQALIPDGLSEEEALEKLKAEVLSLETEVKELRESAEEQAGRSARSFVGDGNRQYLTGMNLGGRNIAILLDTSSSMLADKLVNVIRIRNMAPDIQRSAEKWVRALNTVDWLTSQLPVGSDYQVITFNTQAGTVLPETAGKWLEVADEAQLEELSEALQETLPSCGTSLANAFSYLQTLSPVPDNIFLITDGLPTQGESPPRGRNVSGNQRLELFRQSVRKLPANVPVNIILGPMEGDPMAASEFWQLAQSTRGSFMSPSQDWP